MRKAGLLFVLWASTLLPAWGQVTVEVRLEQEQYLPGETLSVAVRITNRSGQALNLGDTPDWLTFSVESDTGVVPQLGMPPVEGEFTLDSGKVGTKRVDIAPYFSFDKLGRFSVIANVKLNQWGTERTSAPKAFDIIQGSRIWEQEFGLPRSSEPGTDVPEVRRYILQQANYIRGQIRLHVRVTDGAGLKTYRVTPVGKMLSFSRPDAQVDVLSNLHLVYQSGPRVFSYTKYNSDGELMLRQTYDYVDSRPRLQVNAEREIGVIGGARRHASTDIPTPTLEQLTPENESTNAPATEVSSDTPSKDKKSEKASRAESKADR